MNKLTLLLIIFAGFNSFGQKFKYDLDQNKQKDLVEFNQTNGNIKVTLNGVKYNFKAPEIAGYSKRRLVEFNENYINIGYSTSVSFIDLIIKFENKKFWLTNTVFYSPCQSCQNGEVKTCENVIKKEIKEINQNYINTLVFNDKNCRKLYRNLKPVNLDDLYLYVNKIVLKEYGLNQDALNEILLSNPVNKKNIGNYKKIRNTLQKIKFNSIKLEEAIMNFEKK